MPADANTGLVFCAENLSNFGAGATKGFDGGICNGPQFVRNYVESEAHGVPFMTGSSMLLADLSNLSRLSKRDARGPKLLMIEEDPGNGLWRVRQTFADPNGDHDWGISAEVDLAASDAEGRAMVRVTDIGQL